MKYKKILMTCAAAALCVTFQAQPVCAQDMINQNLSAENEVVEAVADRVLKEAQQVQKNVSGEVTGTDTLIEEEKIKEKSSDSDRANRTVASILGVTEQDVSSGKRACL